MDIWLILSIIFCLGNIVILIYDYIKTKKFIGKTESWVFTLRGFHSSLEEGVNVNTNVAESVRRNIYATLSDMEAYLREFKSYRKKEIIGKEHRRELDNT